MPSYLELRSLAPELPFVPVLQGWSLDDHLRCVELHERARANLTREPLVGVGSVCRRQATGEIEVVVYAPPRLPVQGTGIESSSRN